MKIINNWKVRRQFSNLFYLKYVKNKVMSNILEYMKFKAEITYSAEDGLLCGKLLHTDDLIIFHSTSCYGIEKEFHKAVRGYIETCKEIGKSININQP